MHRCVAHAARRATRARRGLPRTPRRRARACLCCEAPPPPPLPLPLRERRPCCSAAAAELLALRGELRAALPTADREQLARELEWLFEDAVEGWEALAARARAGAGAGLDVRARLSAAELRALWLRRLPPHSVPMQYLTASADWRDMVRAVRAATPGARADGVEATAGGVRVANATAEPGFDRLALHSRVWAVDRWHC